MISVLQFFKLLYNIAVLIINPGFIGPYRNYRNESDNL